VKNGEIGWNFDFLIFRWKISLSSFVRDYDSSPIEKCHFHDTEPHDEKRTPPIQKDGSGKIPDKCFPEIPIQTIHVCGFYGSFGH